MVDDKWYCYKKNCLHFLDVLYFINLKTRKSKKKHVNLYYDKIFY